MTPARYLNKPKAHPEYANEKISMPYGMNAKGVLLAIDDVYSYLFALNHESIQHGYPRLEDLMQPAGFSGLLSNIVVRAMASAFSTASPGLAVNTHLNGRPDLVPRAKYPDDYILRGDEGVEVKTSRSTGGWQGHNAESGWILIFQVDIDITTMPLYDRRPTEVVRVMIANLELSDWTFSGRSETSRRTPTASINPSGKAKLLAGAVYDRANAPPVADLFAAEPASGLLPMPPKRTRRPTRSR